MKHEEVASDHFKMFVEDDEPWDDYVERLRTDGEWGGNMELVAAANRYKVHVAVHQLGAPRLDIRSDAPKKEVRRTAHLSYHGEMHYNSVRRRDDLGGDAPSGLPHLDGGDERTWTGAVAAAATAVVETVLGSAPAPAPAAAPARSSPCPCGSGKRYKKCCRAADLARARRGNAPPARDEDDADALAPELRSLSI